MSMRCSNCQKGQVPAAGRAAKNGLCCACDRAENGHQQPEDRAPKIIRRMMIRHQINEETARQFLEIEEKE